jgi:hypothetical protein
MLSFCLAASPTATIRSCGAIAKFSPVMRAFRRFAGVAVFHAPILHRHLQRAKPFISGPSGDVAKLTLFETVGEVAEPEPDRRE